MTEKEKMLKGELYDAFESQLVAERQRAKNLLYEYNRLAPHDTRRREEFMKELMGTIGDNFLIEQPFLCDYGSNIHIGENFYANMNCLFLDEATITIGNNVLFAPNVSLYTAEHPLDVARRNQGLEFARPISIGNNVWIGGSVTIVGGVTIGDNAVIGAGSVVVKDIPPNVLAVGNPCKVIRVIEE